ncbi:MAG: pyruvate kinase [Bacteriovorax sp.]|jgi:ATP sulfurylase
MKKILCTLGPSSLNQKVIQRLDELKVHLFRINLSHTKAEDLANVINTIRSFSNTEICIDTEGAQIRTGDFASKSITVKANQTLKVLRDQIVDCQDAINFYPDYIFDELQDGDLITIDFNSVLAQVSSVEKNLISLRVLNGGVIGQNKAVTVNRYIKMNPLTKKDLTCIEIAKNMGITNYALSFANHGEDVDYVRSLLKKEDIVISKIECNNGLKNLEEITKKSDAILIDRGDLSREQPIERIPLLQQKIIEVAKNLSTEVYVATNLLETMILSPVPTRAELNDIYHTLQSGADGLVLAAETAIGKYPCQAVEMIRKLMHEYNQKLSDISQVYLYEPLSLLTEPHGGKLINQFMEIEKDRFDKLESITIDVTDLLDCEQISSGTYSPLEGFLDERNLISVLEKYRLENGVVWTLPIVLQLQKDQAEKLKVNQEIILTDRENSGSAMLTIGQIYQPDMNYVAQKWFGTTNTAHPGVDRFYKKGSYFISGKVSMIQRIKSNTKQFELMPKETRTIFASKGWSKVIGFHTRNVAHRAHEFIQLTALQKSNADGLFISPVIGPKKKGDFHAKPILETYQCLINSGHYPADKVLLGAFATYSRYSGPREAVFTALCRKNFGCSHFIIGRDHTGVGDFYGINENKELFDKLGDIGIIPIFFNTVGYNERTMKIEESQGEELNTISGTSARQTLLRNEMLPEWAMRNEVQQILLDLISHQEEVFVK